MAAGGAVSVLDADGEDAKYATNETALSVRWAGFAEPCSGVLHYSVSLVDVADDILAALAHKMPKVPQQTLLWIATAAREMKTNTTATHAQRALLPGVLKCIDAVGWSVGAGIVGCGVGRGVGSATNGDGAGDVG